MSEQWKHIFDESACLTKRQLKDYTSGNMIAEECHALEHHVNSCLFCSEAIEGIQGNKASALANIDSIDHNFIKDHFSILHPHVHLNSIAPAMNAPVVRRTKRKIKTPPVFKASNIAAAVLLIIGVMWYIDFSRNQDTVGSTAPATQPAKSSAPKEPAPSESNAGVVFSDERVEEAKVNPGSGTMPKEVEVPAVQAERPTPKAAPVPKEKTVVQEDKVDAKEVSQKPEVPTKAKVAKEPVDKPTRSTAIELISKLPTELKKSNSAFTGQISDSDNTGSDDAGGRVEVSSE